MKGEEDAAEVTRGDTPTVQVGERGSTPLPPHSSDLPTLRVRGLLIAAIKRFHRHGNMTHGDYDVNVAMVGDLLDYVNDLEAFADAVDDILPDGWWSEVGPKPKRPEVFLPTAARF